LPGENGALARSDDVAMPNFTVDRRMTYSAMPASPGRSLEQLITSSGRNIARQWIAALLARGALASSAPAPWDGNVRQKKTESVIWTRFGTLIRRR
jgi:hypothetical protein